MKIQKSTIDSNYKLVTYDNGVEYVVYHSASWLVGATHDEIGTKLKKKFFPSEKAESQDIKTEYYIRGDKGDFYSTTYEKESCYNVALGVKGITWAKRSSAERNLDLARKIDPTCAIFSR
jgi:hypothetical protein